MEWSEKIVSWSIMGWSERTGSSWKTTRPAGWLTTYLVKGLGAAIIVDSTKTLYQLIDCGVHFLYNVCTMAVCWRKSYFSISHSLYNWCKFVERTSDFWSLRPLRSKTTCLIRPLQMHQWVLHSF